MEEEKFISGYCRQQDQSRMVTVIVEDGKVTEADCCYGSCVYEPNCTVAKAIAAAEAPGSPSWLPSQEGSCQRS